jgi:hypothetical protein
MLLILVVRPLVLESVEVLENLIFTLLPVHLIL